MQTAIEAFEKIKASHPNHTVREITAINILQAVQQGDIYLTRVNADHARGKEIGSGDVQIALGTGNGARHMAVGKITVFEGRKLPSGVHIPDVDDAVICGPLIVASDAWSLTHPEHAHFAMPAGTYQVSYQYDPKTMRRVQD